MSLRDVITPLVPSLRRYAHALCGPGLGEAGAADDLVQRTLQRALHDERLKRGGDPRLALYAILTGLNRLRVRDTVVQQHSEQAVLPASRSRPLRERRAGSSIERSLAALSLDLREVILLVVLERLTYDEAAEVTEVPLATALARLTRARDALRITFNGTMRQQPPGERPVPGRSGNHLRVVK